MVLSTYKLFKTMSKQPDWIVLTDNQLHELQHKIVKIAQDVFNLCHAEEIQAMLAYGSVLGAVRHQGFIPWDDDMDLYIARKDCSRFISKFEERYGDQYWIHTPEKTTNYGSLIVKVLLKGTVIRQYEDMETNECGAFLDIFIIENEFDNPLMRRAHAFVGFCLAGFVSCRRFSRDAKCLLQTLCAEPKLKRRVRRKILVGKLLCFLSLDKWVHITNWWFQLCKNEHSRYVTIPAMHTKIFGDFWERSFFDGQKLLRFEEHQWNVPCRTKEYLERVYGDYLQIPPPEKREKHVYLEFKL